MRVLERLNRRVRRIERPRDAKRSARKPRRLFRWAPHYFPEQYTLPPSKIFHEWLADRLDTMTRSERGSRQLVVAPRGSAKSAWVSYAYPLKCALEGTEPLTVIFTDTHAKGENFLRDIRRELVTNDRLAAAYPQSWGRGPIWRSDFIELRNGCGILVMGAGGSVRGLKLGGKRPSLMILDDVERKEHIVSPLRRERTWEWFTKDVLPAGTTATNVVVVGTALHTEAIVCRLQNPKDGAGWHAKVFRAIEEWPKRMDLWRDWQAIYCDYDVPDEEREAKALAFYMANRAAMNE